MHPFLGVLNYGHGGVAVALMGAAGYVLLRARALPERIPTLPALRALSCLMLAAVLAAFVATTWYLFSPTYLDHIEASVASITHYFSQGQAVYPALDEYTFHGLLYGPLLAQLDSLGKDIAPAVLGSKIIGWLAAWLAMGIILARHAGIPGRRDGLLIGLCGVFVLSSFGSLLVSNRADPLLLLLAVLAWELVNRLSGLAAIAALAFLAGLCADLKLHAPLYIIPAAYWWMTAKPARSRGEWCAAAAVSLVAGLAAVSLPFLPQNVQLDGYLTYLRLAGAHGLSGTVFVANLAFAATLWVPVLLVRAAAPGNATDTRRINGFMWTLLVVESAAVIIASKPGAGVHHLLPFIPFHADLTRRLLANVPSRTEDQARASIMLIWATAAVLLGTAWSAARTLGAVFAFDSAIPEQQQARTELVSLSSRYPHGMLGSAGDASFALTHFRPWLTLQGTLQTDYGALMDLKLSGVSDQPLAAALTECRIPYVFMPKPGQPFTLHNIYTGAPLFSEAVRDAFAARYEMRESGSSFDVFACRTGTRSP